MLYVYDWMKNEVWMDRGLRICFRVILAKRGGLWKISSID